MKKNQIASPPQKQRLSQLRQLEQNFLEIQQDQQNDHQQHLAAEAATETAASHPTYNDDETEIATFVDATIQDISNDSEYHFDDDEDDNEDAYDEFGRHHEDTATRASTRKNLHKRNSNDHSRHHHNDFHNHYDEHQNNNSNLNNLSNHSMQSTGSTNNNKTTDEVLSALMEDDDDNLKISQEEVHYFYSQRKQDLQKELEEEERIKKLALERLAAKIRSGEDDLDGEEGDGYEGNGVGLGKVEDYIGKSKKLGMKGATTFLDDDENNEKEEGVIGNDGKETIGQKGDIAKEREEFGGGIEEKMSEDGISIDEEGTNSDDDADIEFAPSSNDNNEHLVDDVDDDDKDENDEGTATGAAPDSPSKQDRDEKVSMLRKNYQAFVTKQQGDDHKCDQEARSNNNDNIDSASNIELPNLKSKNHLYYHFRSGFDYVRKCKMDEANSVMTSRNSKKSTWSKEEAKKLQQSKAISDHEFAKLFHQSPIVRFVDPTSNGIVRKEENDESNTSAPSQRKAWNRSTTKPAFSNLNIFSKINTLLVNQHDSSLKSIRYKNLRTNGIEVIENIPIRPMLNTDNVSDPADWHKGPLCHVYIAACASIDHYRAKVRPFLKAFVSQIDGAGSGDKDSVSSAAKKAMKKEYHQKDKNSKDKHRAMKKEQVAQASLAAAKAKDAAGSSASSKYMIIYVPIHPSCIDPITGLTTKDKKKTSGGFFGMSRGGNRNNDTSTLKSDEWTMDDDVSVMADEHQLNPSIFRKLTKEQKEIFNKFYRDFPNAQTCLLSSLLDKDYELAAESDVQNQEMHEFLQTLGKVMISGFTDRVQCYNHEIMKCREKKSKSMESFNWSQYFLVKESLALTYEQLQLPHEALEEYQELESIIPHVAWPDEDVATQDSDLSRAASYGDAESFREILRSKGNISYLSHFYHKYLFVRQGRLFLLLKQPISVIEKFVRYVRKVHYLRYKQCEGMMKEEQSLALAKNEAWAVSACWEIKNALTAYFPFSLTHDQEVSKLDDEEKKCCNALLELLNFARMRLNKLGDLLYTSNNTITRGFCGRPSDCNIPWVKWDVLAEGTRPKKSTPKDIAGRQDIIDELNKEEHTATPWVRNSVKCCSGYENVYIEISDLSIRLNILVDQVRCAARLSGEQAEYHIIRGDYDKAAQRLLPTIDLSMSEPWDSLLSWRLFRLICCQRISGSPPEYLRSLTSCFEPRSVKAMPPKLIDLLITDLEAVVNSKEILGHTWGLSPFIGVDIIIESTKGGEIIESSHALRKKIIKNVCFVGEEVVTELNLVSALPRTITVESVKLNFLKLDDYIIRHKSGISEDMGDTATLDLGGAVNIQPGRNIFQLPWTVMTVGQYAITSVEIQWNNAFFMQDYCIPKYPALCFDVLPNEPTQSIELDPIFLVSLLEQLCTSTTIVQTYFSYEYCFIKLTDSRAYSKRPAVFLRRVRHYSRRSG